jgi:flagellar biosynthetic protein FliR
MITLNEAQLLAWLTPVLWPFLRVLALFQAMPVMGQRMVPVRVRVALAFLVAVCASGVAPAVPPVPLDSALAVLLVVQQLLIGISLGFAVRIVFACIEFAGEIAGLQMGMNFAGFFDPITAGQSTAVSRFFGTLVAFLFIAVNGHLTVIAAVVQSLTAFPVSAEPFAFLKATQPHVWGAEVFKMGLWLALPLIGIMMFVNVVLGVISRVAPQTHIFSIGFPITMGLGLASLLFILPLMEGPFIATLERMLAHFQ